ncbi:MAG: ATP-binding cassette domain-containing protein, partial [Rugosibacter sp.]|nr:ATP-binding cassette domain-containing protein [Rugosibacter sp.]
ALLIYTGFWARIWVLFGGANQLMASLALLLASLWLMSNGKKYMWTFVPFIFMFVTTVAALLITAYNVIKQVLTTPDLPIDKVIGNWLAGLIAIYLVVAAVILAMDALKALMAMRAERAARRAQMGNVRMQVDQADASGKMVFEAKGLSHAFGASPVVKDLSVRVMRGDRIGLIGPNGAGKTTLLRLILGQIEADSGTVRLGSRVEVAYFDQFRTQLDPEATLADVISPGSDYVEIGGMKKHVIGYLEDFLFAPARARSPVKSLSGGERNRLLLARLFARPANVLVLDEPTNDLDIETLELLEALLQEYAGTVFLVSHDRAFLDNVVTQTIVSEGEGRWKEYVGGYSDWLQQRPAAEANLPVQPKKVGSGDTAKVVSAATQSRKKLSFKEQRELEQLPERLAALEAEQALLQQGLADPNFYQQPIESQRQAQTRLAEVDAAIDAALMRWEALEAMAD